MHKEAQTKMKGIKERVSNHDIRKIEGNNCNRRTYNHSSTFKDKGIKLTFESKDTKFRDYKTPENKFYNENNRENVQINSIGYMYK